jgi:hypothetical protein
MKKKLQITKLDIARWISVLPVTVLLLILYTTVILDFFYMIFNKFFNEEIVSHIMGFINAVSLPALIIACGYYISPKFKFKSTLILVLIFASLQLFQIYYRVHEHMSLNPFIALSALVYLLGMYFVYRIESKK